MQTIVVVAGGFSGERAVSLRSGAAVASALKVAGYDVRLHDLRTTELDEIIDCDVVFPVLHGAGGEDGTLQKELEIRSARFVGSGSVASALCFDKWQYRQKVTATGLPMAEGALVTADAYASHPLAQTPHVLKPCDGGSSLDTFIIRDTAKTPAEQIAMSFERYEQMLLETLVVGTELTVGVLGDTTLPVIEIIPPDDGEFDYENKYNGKSQELCPPEHVGIEIQQKAQELALRAHRLTGCRDFSRTDIMCDKTGKLFLLETNTIPGMTDQSLLPKMAACAGIDMPALCGQLVEMALRRA